MSVSLTRLCFAQIGLTPTQKHILTVLCFIANDDNEVYCTLDNLEKHTGLSLKTLERSLKALREKNILLYTDKYMGKFNKIPIYSIVLDNGLSVRDQKSITDFASLEDGLCVPSNTDTVSGLIDYVIDNIKDNTNNRLFHKENAAKPLKKPSQSDFQEYASKVKGFEWVGEWLLENKGS